MNTAADLTTNITEPIRKSSLGNSTASDVITYLLKCGANINAVDNYNQTPLNYAAVKGNIEAMAILLKWPGIDVEVLIFFFFNHNRYFSRCAEVLAIVVPNNSNSY